jgi:hypothetical protein
MNLESLMGGGLVLFLPMLLLSDRNQCETRALSACDADLSRSVDWEAVFEGVFQIGTLDVEAV